MGERCFKIADQNGRECAACHRDNQPRKTKPETAPRRCAPDLLDVKTERLEKFGAHRRSATMSIFAFTRLQNFLGKQIRVDHADDVALLVHNGEGEKLVEHKEFASVQDGCVGRNGNDALHHDLAQLCFQRCGQQATRWNHADKPTPFVHYIKVNDTLAYAFAPDALECFAHGHIVVEQRKILTRVLDNRRLKIGNAGSDVHLATR